MARTIVVPLDGSALGERAMLWAASLARKLGLSLTLVQVVPWPNVPATPFAGGYMSPEAFDELLAAEHNAAREYLDRLSAEWSKHGLSVSTVVRDGMAAEGILDVADELGAYAIAIASHGRGGATRLLLGSVAERLLQQATLPVLLVRAGGEVSPASFHEVLVPLDGSPLAERAIDHAREIVGEHGLLVLERAVEPVYEVLGNDLGAPVVNEVATAEAEAQARAYLDRIASPLIANGARVLLDVSRGEPAKEVLAAAERLQVSLIVMTTHGRTGPARWVVGSVADEVFRKSDRPVLLVSARTVASRIGGTFTVGELMTRDVEAVREDESVISALRKLLRRRVSGAPVINAAGELVGVLSERDLLAWHSKTTDEVFKNIENLDPATYRTRIESETVAAVMNRPPVSIEVGADLSAGIRMLMGRGVRRLPVTDRGRLVGVLSRADILKAMAEQWHAAESSD